MEYEDLIKEEAGPSAEKPEGEDEFEAVEVPAKSPWKAFILTGLLASLFGAVGGGAGIYAALNKISPKSATTQTVDLSPLEGNFKRLSTRLKTAEDKLQEVANRPAPEPTQDFEPTDLSDVENRLQALESAPRPEIDPEALSALQSAQKDGFKWPDVSNLETRIESLESEPDAEVQTELPAELLERLTALEENIDSLQNAPSETGQAGEALSALEARLAALENRPAPIPVVERVSILAFPKDQLMDALETTKSGNLIEKTLSRHIRVKDANDPLTLIEGIETDLSGGDLTAALEKFKRLPEPVQSAGQAWYESVKASL